MELLILSLYILFTITSVRALLSLLRSSKPSPKLPPGPVPLPVIGSFLKLGDKPHKSLAELAKIYGPIMSLKLGQKITVVISSLALVKEILQKQDLAFSTRSIPNAAHAHGHHIYSTIWLPVSNQWLSLRKVLNSIIFSGKRLDANQNIRQQKVKELIEYAGKCCQEDVAVDIGMESWMDCPYRFYKGLDKLSTSLHFGPKYMESMLYEQSPPEDLSLATVLMRPYPIFHDYEEMAKDTALTKKNHGSVHRVYIVIEEDSRLK
ncbi:hypothetical protein RHGRI_004529 [Rhododendron griersonianum]|uniref:Cytochrome P450 n=1 Tax=Rhododendron griersonianum TaxID=479676 RepID=A0AAV6L995_9ERIC|nr:hypothetical protein RHGRI_004529 [Rhododendron griersonianum]